MTVKTRYILCLIIVMVGSGGCSTTPPITNPPASPDAFASSTSEDSLPLILTATLLPGFFPPPSPEYPKLVTPRVTPFPTKTRAEAKEQLRYMLRTNGNCTLPCFWGIHPDITGYEELYSVIDQLGGSRFEALDTNSHINVFTGFRLEDNDGVQIEFAADLQDDIVKELKIRLLNLYSAGVTLEDWSAYNLDKVQNIYGTPDVVELGFAQISNAIWFMVALKYESINTVIVYTAGAPEGGQFLTSDSAFFCPKEIGFDTVTLYLGNYPFNTIPSGTPLLKATGLSEQDFHKLFTENPSACLTLNRAGFYP